MNIWSLNASLYKPPYKPPPGLKALVTGMPRSGTSFLRTVLDRRVATGHESIFGVQKVYDEPLGGRVPVIEVSGFASPWAKDCLDAGVKVIRLMRDPLKCCTSCLNYFTVAGYDIDWESTCEAFYERHEVFDDFPHMIIQIEDSWPGICNMLDMLGYPRGFWPDRGEVEATSHGGSSWPEPRKNWEDLPLYLQQWGARYGYGP